MKNYDKASQRLPESCVASPALVQSVHMNGINLWMMSYQVNKARRKTTIEQVRARREPWTAT